MDFSAGAMAPHGVVAPFVCGADVTVRHGDFRPSAVPGDRPDPCSGLGRGGGAVGAQGVGGLELAIYTRPSPPYRHHHDMTGYDQPLTAMTCCFLVNP